VPCTVWSFGITKDAHDVNSQDVWFDVSVLEGFSECLMWINANVVVCLPTTALTADNTSLHDV